jgi:hypothetical protein
MIERGLEAGEGFRDGRQRFMNCITENIRRRFGAKVQDELPAANRAFKF